MDVAVIAQEEERLFAELQRSRIALDAVDDAGYFAALPAHRALAAEHQAVFLRLREAQKQEAAARLERIAATFRRSASA